MTVSGGAAWNDVSCGFVMWATGVVAPLLKDDALTYSTCLDQ